MLSAFPKRWWQGCQQKEIPAVLDYTDSNMPVSFGRQVHAWMQGNYDWLLCWAVYFFQNDVDFKFSILDIISHWIIRRLVTCFFLEYESAIDGSLTMIRSGECHEGSQDVKNGVATTGCCFTSVSWIHIANQGGFPSWESLFLCCYIYIIYLFVGKMIFGTFHRWTMWCSSGDKHNVRPFMRPYDSFVPVTLWMILGWVMSKQWKRNTALLQYVTVHITYRAQMTSIFGGQPLKTKPFPTKTMVVWVLGMYR